MPFISTSPTPPLIKRPPNHQTKESQIYRLFRTDHGNGKEKSSSTEEIPILANQYRRRFGMVLNRPTVIRLADLHFSSLEHLKSWCDVTHKQKWEQAISRLACTKAFDHAERVFDEAKLKMQEGDEEDAYKLFTRMGVISKIIISKNDFQEFKNSPDGRRFYSLFEQCIAYLKELEESLNKRYELKKVEKSYDERDLSVLQSEETRKDKDYSVDESLVIDPRDLVRYIACKHRVLVIDYRNDQTDVIQYANAGLLVAQVPSDAIVPGCIGSSLIRSAEIGQRAILQRMTDVDMVVLMGNESAPNEEKDMIAGSKEQILYSALSMYNNNFRLRKPPKFLKGGFESWRLYYPMHTSTKSAMQRKFVDIANRTEFARAVAEYKKDFGIDFLEYPQLLPVIYPKKSGLSMPHSSVSDSVVHHMGQSSSYSSMLMESADVSDKPSVSSLGSPLPPKNGLLDIRIDATGTTNESSAIIDSVITETAVPPIHQSATKNSNSQIDVPALQSYQFPIIDRSKKPPSELFLHKEKASSEKSFPIKPTLTMFGGAKLYDASAKRTPVNIPAIPDRLLKPQLLLSDGSHQLLHLYESMMNILSLYAVPESCNSGYTGLYNLGNTCFMNSVLQTLFNTIPLRRIFTKNEFVRFVNRNNKMGTMGVISSVFSAMMDSVWSGLFKALRPQQFLETFAAEVNASLADGQQHDAQEFQIYLLDALHEDTNRVVKRITFEQNYTGADLEAEAADYNEKLRRFACSPISDIFNCQTVSSLQCNKCKRQSVTFEELAQLSIEVPNRNSTIEDCIRNHFQDVELDGSCKWRCPNCESLQTATRRTFLWKLPEVLVIHLKRFTFMGDNWQKNDAYVAFNTFPLKLQAEYFSLYAVINHRGSLNSGHYTAVVRNQTTKQWLLFDDDLVAPIDVDLICSKSISFIIC
uniref:Ubiquitin carboxyl-terminal hydrolase n=1 Tax=Loa loa TaxID=7209 RepID=A0A1I7VRX1_LOALO